MRIVGAHLSKKSVVTMDSRPSKALAENRDVGKKKGEILKADSSDTARYPGQTWNLGMDCGNLDFGSYAGRGASINRWIKKTPESTRATTTTSHSKKVAVLPETCSKEFTADGEL